MDHPVCVEGGELSVCASNNPLGLLFIFIVAGKTQAWLLALGKSQTATALKCFYLKTETLSRELCDIKYEERAQPHKCLHLLEE